jgi:hypothetical protein
MARTKGPDEQIAVLSAERLRIAVDKDAASRAVREAKEILGTDGPRSATNRTRLAMQAAARGRPHEAFEEIAASTAEATAAIQVNTTRVEALAGALREIAREIEAVEDGHLEHFAKQASAASIEAVEAQATARQALNAAFEAWRGADGAWGRVRAARRRLDWPPLPACPVTDLASVLSGFETACRQRPWPGGRRPEEDSQLDAAWREVDWPVRWDGPRTP